MAEMIHCYTNARIIIPYIGTSPMAQKKKPERLERWVNTMANTVTVKQPKSDFEELRQGVTGAVLGCGNFGQGPVYMVGHMLEGRNVRRWYPAMDTTPTNTRADLLDVANAILARWRLEPEGAIFPGAAMMEELQIAIVDEERRRERD